MLFRSRRSASSGEMSFCGLGDALVSLANADGASAKPAAAPPTVRRKLRREVPLAANASLARHLRHMVVLPAEQARVQSGREPIFGQRVVRGSSPISLPRRPPSAAIGKPEVNPDLIHFIGCRPQGIDFPAIFCNDTAGSPGRGKMLTGLSRILARPGYVGLTVSPAEPAIVQARAMPGK